MKKTITLSKKVRALIFLGWGALFSLAFAPYYQLWLAPLCLSSLFWNINKSEKGRYVFAKAFLFGFGFGVISTSWLANAIALGGESFLFLIPLAWIGMGLLFGLFYGIPAYLSSFIQPGFRRLLAWAAWFTLFEWIRSWFLTGFPWNLTGSIFEDTLPILQSASVWGVYGLSFIAVLIGSVLALLPQKRPLLYAGCFLALLYGIGAARLYSADNTVVWGMQLRLVQPNIPQTLKWNPKEAENSFLKLMHLSRQNNDKITHVIWPESAVPFVINRDENERLRLMQAIRQGGTLITGGIRMEGKGNRQAANSLFILDDLANIRAYYDKSHLVPFGEYVPLRDILPFEKLVPLSVDFMAGEGPKTIRTGGTPTLGPLVCYEVIFSGKVAEKERRPQWLVNVTNDGWYGISSGPYQHLGMAKMRAVEEGLPLARAANTGISAVFDGYGRTVGMLPLGTEGVLDVSLPTALKTTLYAQYGVRIPVLFSLILLVFLYSNRFWLSKKAVKSK